MLQILIAIHWNHVQFKGLLLHRAISRHSLYNAHHSTTSTTQSSAIVTAVPSTFTVYWDITVTGHRNVVFVAKIKKGFLGDSQELRTID